MTAQRMLTGDRPTGKLHLGHYVGSIANRVKLHRKYESFFIIADLHMLTTKNTRDDIAQATQNARDMVVDCLAAGIDPETATFYLQSAIQEVGDLNTLFQNLVTVPRLERVPSLKDMARDAGKDEMPYGLLGYPVLQAADILCVKAHVVPVGKDNAAHVEVTREIARRFNHLYGDVFPVPELVSADTPTLVGTDGRAKMSKSLGNAIALSDDAGRGPPQGHGHVHRPEAHPGRRARHGRGQPGVPVPRRVQPEPGRGRRPQEPLPRGQGRRRRGQGETRHRAQRVPRPHARTAGPLRGRQGSGRRTDRDGTERTRREVQQTVFEARKAMGLTGVYTQLRRKAERSRKTAATTA